MYAGAHELCNVISFSTPWCFHEGCILFTCKSACDCSLSLSLSLSLHTERSPHVVASAHLLWGEDVLLQHGIGRQCVGETSRAEGFIHNTDTASTTSSSRGLVSSHCCSIVSLFLSPVVHLPVYPAVKALQCCFTGVLFVVFPPLFTGPTPSCV